MLKPYFSYIKFLVGLLVLFSYLTSAKSDGGGRMEISPYSSGENITFEKVNKLKESSRSSMTTTYGSNGIKENLNNVGIAWMKAGKQMGKIEYKLNGQQQGGQAVKIDFSEIQEFQLLKLIRRGGLPKPY